MHTLLIVPPTSHVPHALRELVRTYSTSVEQVVLGTPDTTHPAGRVLTWANDAVWIDGRRWRWPDDLGQIRELLELGTRAA